MLTREELIWRADELFTAVLDGKAERANRQRLSACRSGAGASRSRRPQDDRQITPDSMSEYAQRRQRIARAAERAQGRRADRLRIAECPISERIHRQQRSCCCSPRSQAILFTDPRYTIQASQKSDCTARIVRGSLYDAASKLLKRKKWKRIGIERNRLTFGGYSEIQEKLDLSASLRPTAGLVERQRMIKSAG